MVIKMYNDDPFLGITKPMPLFNSTIYPIDKGKFVEIQLYKKRAEKYYEVVFHNLESEIYFGKFTKDNNLLGIKYNDGKILVYNESFNHEKRKMNIVEVLALYDIEDDTFYYCTEENAISMFDENIDCTGLINPTKKILRTKIRKKILADDNENFEIKNFYTVNQKNDSFNTETDEKKSGNQKIYKLF